MRKNPKLNSPPQNAIKLRLDENEKVQPYFANCWNVAREDGFFRINLACSVGGQLLQAITLILPEETIFLNKEETVEYFNKMSDVVPAKSTQFMAPSTEVLFGFLLAFSRNGAIGEINPMFFRLNLLANAGGDVRASVGASINVPIAVQIGIVKEIFINE